MSEYREWLPTFEQAALALVDRQEQVDAAAELIEKNLFLLGATGIEDKLQDGVPQTIQVLSDAGVRIWVLTGDRQETAINIGYSCRLLVEDMSLITCNEKTHFETKEVLERKLEAVRHIVLADQADQGGADEEAFALIIDGKSLDYAFEDDIRQTFLALARLCRTVICCRVSPLQKSLVVRLVRENVDAVTLAIGDGANDVGMIQAAHIGIGISGEEGLQAARAADFSIAQFRFLQKLMLVHGQWSYRRLSKLIMFSFFKNISLYMIQFWVQFSQIMGQLFFII